MANIKESPVSNPANRFTRDPNRHYVICERESDKFPDSPLDNMLTNTLSETNPDELKYRLEGNDVRVSGDKRMSLLSCSIEDYEMAQKLNAKEAESRVSIPDSDTSSALKNSRPGAKSFRSIERGDEILASE